MKITFKPHTVVVMVGPTRCGKSAFVSVAVDQLKEQTRTLALSSDGFRNDLLQELTVQDGHSRNMLEVSHQAFDLLLASLKAYTEFPVNTGVVFVDTRGFDKGFREEIVKIARGNGYNVDCICFDYKNAADYLIHTDEYHSKVVLEDVQRFRRKCLPELGRRDFDQFIRVRDPKFLEGLEVWYEDAPTIVVADYSQSFAVVGDTHECVTELDTLLNMLPEDVSRIIHVGDYLDKGHNTAEMVKFMHNRVTGPAQDIMVIGNHESYVYRRLKGDIPPAPKEVEEMYFTSIPVLLGSDELRNKFFEIYERSLPFVKVIGCTAPIGQPNPFRTTYVTHAPCDNKFLGKLTDQALRAQRNLYIKNREGDERDEMKFVFTQASPIEPLHIFGHMAHSGKIEFKNKLFLDTGCVHGGKLTAAVVKNGEYQFVSVPGVNKMPKELRTDLSSPKKEVKPFSIHDYDLSPDDQKFLRRTMANGVKFISGTMAPAPSFNGHLEPLEAALDYYQKRGISQVVMQPKYMGSRCQFYLDFLDPTQSKAVSRNGHVIRHVEGLPELLVKWSETTGDNLCANHFPGAESIILDGELLPWSALGSGLIENEFKTYGALVNDELTTLSLDTVFQGFDIGKSHDTVGRLEDYEVFAKTLNLYGNYEEPSFKPFNILEVDGKPYEEGPNYAFKLNDDAQCVVDLDDPEGRKVAAEYFRRRTMVEGMEGVVVKPIREDNNAPFEVPEYMKVRNEQYLTLVYGYDYKRRYDRMVQQKNISGKVRISIAESNLGRSMLKASEEDRPEFIVKMISELKRERSLDPRL